MASQCEVSQDLHQAQAFSNGLTIRHVMVIVAAACTLVAVVLCLWLYQRHLLHYVCSEQQRYLVRIAVLPAIFAVFHLLGVIFYDVSRYLEPFPTLFEAISICSLFELYVTYVCPGVPNDPTARFRHVAGIGSYAEKGPRMLRNTYLFIYQFPFVTLLCLIATEVTSALQCELSAQYRKSTRIIRVVQSGSTIIALIQLIMFHRNTRRELRGMKAVRKLVAIKALAFVVIIMTLVFSFFKPSMGQPSTHVSYFDLTVGLPNFLICIEMFLFAIAWVFLFGLSSVQHDPAAKRVSALTALGQVMNISDIGSNALVVFAMDLGNQSIGMSSVTSSASVRK